MNKEDLIEYLNTHDMDVQSARAMFLFAELVYQSYADSCVVGGKNFSPVIFNFTAGRFYQLIDRGVINEVARRVYEDFVADNDSLDNLIAGHRSYEFLMDEVWGKIKSRLKEADLETLKGFYSELLFLAERWWHYAAIGEDKGGLIERELAPKMAQKHGVLVGEIIEAIGVLSHPKELAFFTKERKDFYKLCLFVLSNKSVHEEVINEDVDALKEHDDYVERVNEFAKKYFWKDTDFYERRVVGLRSVTREVKKEVVKHGVKQINKEMAHIDEGLAAIRKMKKEVLGRFELDEEDKGIILFAEKMTEWQDFRKLGMMKHLYYLFALLEALAKKLGASYEDLAYSTIEELEKIMKGEGKVNKEAIIRRKGGTVFVFEKEKPLVELKSDASRAVIDYIEREVEGELKGTVASVGKDRVKRVKGKVRVVINPLKERFLPGEILVTSMTRVEFVPIMKKAKAIITDEGGLSCHAAIVSRELGVPAIIGVRRATKVLNSGDIVELDMETGVISKKLSK